MSEQIFSQPDNANRALHHLSLVLGHPLPESFLPLFLSTSSPDLALANLGRWLAATTNAQVHLHQLVEVPALAKLLIMIFGASQPMTDSLIQNPELASLVLDPSELERPVVYEQIVREGALMLAASNSPSHALDRLRFLKQRWTLPIVINDLAGTWSEETIWQVLSDLAEALINLTVQAVWQDFARQKNLSDECPVMVVGFGKLGGRELNFSSDIDLSYVITDGLGENWERDATRFCELLSRGLSERMGRGSLYRVDMRLRPYGNAGPLIASMRSVEHYYQLYAEHWELQALLRSKPIVGPQALIERWSVMRKERCFRPQLSEPELEAMLSMKTRIEERAEIGDIKRGAGGIRDVEFLVQALQLIHGHRHQELQVASTLSALRALESFGILDHAVCASLESGYIFLRQLEHRCQLVGDQQTHSIPSDDLARRRLAMLMGKAHWQGVESELEDHRRTIQTLYKSILKPETSPGSDRDRLAQRLGQYAPSVFQWFDSMPASGAFYTSLLENRDSLDRVEKITISAPKLVNELKKWIGLTELLVSGEVEEAINPHQALSRLPLDSPLQIVAETYAKIKCQLLVKWVLFPDQEVGNRLADVADAFLVHCCKRLLIRFDVVALGSYGAQEMGADSDADLLLLVQNSDWQAEAESQAQQLLALLGQLKRIGATLGIDLRLRPDGGKGMLVRSLEALGAYELSGMEMWERFALRQARLVHGDPLALQAVRKVAYAQPLTPERLRELLAMKKRVETERVKPQYIKREVKLGFGGLDDIEWLIHLYEMRYPTATRAYPGDGDECWTADRIRNLGRAGLVNAVEVEQLQEAHRHLLEVRLRLSLLALDKDVIPENPDKLDRLASSMDIPTGNDFLAIHNRIIDTVRHIYLQGLERLNA